MRSGLTFIIPVIAMLAVLLPGCVPQSGGSSGGGGGGGTNFTADFQMPDDGQTLVEPFTIEVTGKSIAVVWVRLDGDLLLEDFEAPYELTIDPTTYPKGVYRLTVTAQDPRGDDYKQTVFINFSRPRPPVSEILAAIDNLGPGEWYEIPETWMADVAYRNPDDTRGSIGAIMAASGGAFDTSRNRLLVWGGGQGAYAGNEIYAFDLDTVEWMRLMDPSPWPPGEAGNPNSLVMHPDNGPVARHTFDSIEYLPPPMDKFVVCGGVFLYRDAQRDENTYLYDFETSTWSVLEPTSTASGGSIAGVGPDGRVWHQGGQGVPKNHLAVLDPVSGMWTHHVDWLTSYKELGSTGDIDPVRNVLVDVGVGFTATWDLLNPDNPAVILPTTGATEIQFVEGPGLAYHPGRDVMVAWGGGPAVYTLDLDTAVWTRVDPTNDVNPGTANPRGTFGRFRYCPDKDLFVVVNSVGANVFVYRLP